MKTWLYDLLKPLVRAYYFLVRGIRATGTENVASPGGYILCSNHVSASDPFVLATCVRRRLHFMAKAELFKNRVVGGFISAIGAFPIRRGESDLGAVRESIRLLNEGHVVGIFPQGTRSRDNAHTHHGAGRGAHRPARRRQGRARLHRRPLPPLPQDARRLRSRPCRWNDLGRRFDRATLDQGHRPPRRGHLGAEAAGVRQDLTAPEAVAPPRSTAPSRPSHTAAEAGRYFFAGISCACAARV